MTAIGPIKVDIRQECTAVLKQLNPEQRAAVEAYDRPLLVVAPAGTGKTHVLSARYLLLRAQGIKPNNILGLTFSRRAANEMRERIAPALVGYADADVYVDTFHGIGLRILKTLASEFGLRPGFRIAEDEEQRLMMHEATSKCDPDSLGTPDHANVRLSRLLEMLERIKTSGTTPTELLSGDRYLNGQVLDTVDLATLEEYESILRLENKVDFADLILKPLLFFKARPEEGTKWAKAFKAVLVDEYQDTNQLQYQILRILTAETQSVMLLGDDDQLIFSWRGADTNLILNFEAQWTNGQAMTLTKNYRNASGIIERAKLLISNNENRRKKTMQAMSQHDAVIDHRSFETQSEEQDFIAREIKRQIENGVALDQIAVLTRVKTRAAEIALSLSANGIPCHYPDNDTMKTREARSLVAWARVYLNPEDNLALTSAMSFPHATLTQASIDQLKDMSRLQNKSLIEVCRELMKIGKAKADGPLASFLKRVDAVRSVNLDDARIFRHIAREAGIENLTDGANAEGSVALEQLLDILTNIFDETGSLAGVLEAINIGQRSTYEAQQGIAKVRIDTMHSSKGLEYDTIIAPGWEENSFPLNGRNPADLQEERRIAYVTLTRARRTFIVTTARHRPGRGKSAQAPSRFINEINLSDDVAF